MTAPRLVFLHGFAGRPESWTQVLEHLPSSPATLTPTLVGHDSPPVSQTPAKEAIHDSPPVSQTPAGAGFKAEVDRLAAVIDGAGFSASHLVGYSLGGRLALGLLCRHPGLFSAATLIGTHPGLTTAEQRRERVSSDEAWARRLEDEGLEAFLDLWEEQPLFATQGPYERAAQRRLRRGLQAAGLARAMRALGLGRMPDYRATLEKLPHPVCWVAGERDPKFSSLARDCAGASPSARVQIVSGAGHNVVLERPAAVAGVLFPPEARYRAENNALEGSLT